MFPPLSTYLPAHLYSCVAYSIEEIREDFMKLVSTINTSEKPMWTMIKELRDSIPVFIDSNLTSIIADSQNSPPTNSLLLNNSKSRTFPKKPSVSTNHRSALNNIITRIEQYGLLQIYLSRLLIIINQDEQPAAQMTKPWRHRVKSRLISLLLLVYQFTPDKLKRIFNIIDLWHKIYPNHPICALRDERFTKKNKAEETQNAESTLDPITLLEIEFLKNMRISGTGAVVAEKGAQEEEVEENQTAAQIWTLSQQLEDIQIEPQQSTCNKQIAQLPTSSQNQSLLPPFISNQKNYHLCMKPNYQQGKLSSSAAYFHQITNESKDMYYSPANNSPASTASQQSRETQGLALYVAPIIYRNPNHFIFDQQNSEAQHDTIHHFNRFVQSQ